MTYGFRYLFINGVDYGGSALDEVTVETGRRTAFDKVRPATLSARFLRTGTLPTVGATVQLSLGDLGIGVGYRDTRFTGRITGVKVDRTYVEVEAVSNLLGYLATVSGTWTAPGGTFADYDTYWQNAWNETTPLYKFSGRALNQGVGPSVTCATYTYTGTYLDFLNNLAQGDIRGVIYETFDYPILPTSTQIYLMTVLNRPYSGGTAFPSAYVRGEWQTEQTLQDLGNSVTVTYPTAADGSTTATTVLTDAASIAAYGTVESSWFTPNMALDDAQSAASLKLAQAATPRWTTSTITVDCAAAGAVLFKMPGGRYNTSSLAAVIPNFPSNVFVEGIRDRVTNKGHWQDLYLSDALLTQNAERYVDITPNTLAYSGVGATVAWKDVLTTPL